MDINPGTVLLDATETNGVDYAFPAGSYARADVIVVARGRDDFSLDVTPGQTRFGAKFETPSRVTIIARA